MYILFGLARVLKNKIHTDQVKFGLGGFISMSDLSLAKPGHLPSLSRLTTRISLMAMTLTFHSKITNSILSHFYYL